MGASAGFTVFWFEDKTMKNLVTRALNLLTAPRARLQSDFPWTIRKMGRTYLFASLWFYAGSLVVPGLYFALLFVAPHVNLDLFMWLGDFLGNSNEVSVRFLVMMSAISFVMGFVAELLYLRSVMHREGRTLRKTVGLNIDRLKGRTKLRTAWNFFWPVALAWGIWFSLEQLVTALFGHAPQNTVDLFKSSTGLDFAILAAMAVFGAPVFEELVFRGFLQGGASSSLKRHQLRKLLSGNRRATEYLAGVQTDEDKLIPMLGGNTLKAEYLAACLSAALFAVMHMQFHPVTLLLLFTLGFIHSELYRRTGSLYCSMLLHFVNNGLAVGLLLWSRF